MRVDVSLSFFYPRILCMPASQKPKALRHGAAIRVIAPASPSKDELFQAGCRELERRGFRLKFGEHLFATDGYCAGTRWERAGDLLEALRDTEADAIFCARGGYGTDQLLTLAEMEAIGGLPPKLLMGYSDIGSLQIFLWENHGWVTVYGPMVAKGFAGGEDAAGGYDAQSLDHALRETTRGWEIPLPGESLIRGNAEGTLLGGCLTMVECTLGTPWELNTEGAILLLEDLMMKPYQVERSLMHLRNAGKLEGVRGFIFGEFPGCEPAAPSPITVREVVRRQTEPLGVPVVWGAPFGHTKRPMLTVPLGVRALLDAKASAQLSIQEAACTE
jgi:muramoyltetrapeptide carboxypeptidase